LVLFKRMIRRIFKKTGYDIVFFDCDSTLTDIEGIDELGKMKGVELEIKMLTEKAMNGDISFDEVLPARLEIIKPNLKDMERLTDLYVEHRIRDAQFVIKTLTDMGKKVFIITGGYRQAIVGFARYLGIPEQNVCAVDLEFDSYGRYCGFKDNPLIKKYGKREILREKGKHGSTILVGDGATDLEAKEVVDLFVGFGGVVKRPIVMENADFFIGFPTLLPIIPLVAGLSITNFIN